MTEPPSNNIESDEQLSNVPRNKHKKKERIVEKQKKSKFAFSKIYPNILVICLDIEANN